MVCDEGKGIVNNNNWSYLTSVDYLSFSCEPGNDKAVGMIHYVYLTCRTLHKESERNRSGLFNSDRYKNRFFFPERETHFLRVSNHPSLLLVEIPFQMAFS